MFGASGQPETGLDVPKLVFSWSEAKTEKPPGHLLTQWMMLSRGVVKHILQKLTDCCRQVRHRPQLLGTGLQDFGLNSQGRAWVVLSGKESQETVQVRQVRRLVAGDSRPTGNESKGSLSEAGM